MLVGLTPVSMGIEQHNCMQIVTLAHSNNNMSARAAVIALAGPLPQVGVASVSGAAAAKAALQAQRQPLITIEHLAPGEGG